MSRIGKRPVPLPPKVTVTIKELAVSVKGPKGELNRVFPSGVVIAQAGEELVVSRANESRTARQRHGLCRTLLSNMVDGVSKGFEKKLEIQGVGYRAQTQGRKLILNVGYSKPVEIEPPQGIDVVVEANTNVTVKGIDKELVGNTAARIRQVRPPEVYKGKGIRYAGEVVRTKAGKSGKK